MPSKERTAQLKRNQVVFDEHNAKAKKRREKRDKKRDDWSKNRVADPMFPYVRDSDQDTRDLVGEGPHRAYLHAYGFTRSERRRALGAYRRVQRQKARRRNTPLFWQIWESQRLTDAKT